MATYGEGLYAKIAEKLRTQYFPNAQNIDFDIDKVLDFFRWRGQVRDKNGRDISADIRKEVTTFLNHCCSGKEPLLKHIGRRGLFRVVNTELEEYDLTSAMNGTTLDLLWPFDLEKYILLYPGSLALLAGTSGAGKSAFVNNFIALNLERYNCHLFTSDMTEEELADRLSPLGIIGHENLHAHPRSSDYSDVLFKDDLNCIDYIEYVENVSEIKTEIELAYRAMEGGDGLLLITIQKKFNTKTYKGEIIKHDLGYGRETTLGRPKLYLSMNPNSLKIIKSRKRTDPDINPNGLGWTFKLVEGYRFVNIYPDEEIPQIN